MVMSCNARWKVRIVRKQEQVSDPSNKATQLFSPRRTLEEKKKRLWLFSPSRWKTNATYSLSASTTHKAASQGVLINANDRCYRSIIALTNVSKSSNSAVRIGSQSAPRCDHRELVTPSSKNTTGLQETFALSPFAVLFHGSYAPLLTQIFGYLSGASIIRNRILNKLCHTVLPQAITDLRISTIALTKLLKGLQSDRRVNGSSLLPKLQHLCVVAERIKQASSLPPRSIPCDNKRFSFGNSASHGTSNHSVVASSCLPQRSSSRTTSGELTITTLAHVLAANGCPQLRKLCLCSTFINSVSGNAVFHLTEALKAGCCRELEYLWLGGNALGDYGAMCVSHVIQANACPKLVLLDLRSNFIAQDGIRYLSTAFASLTEKCHIRQLCLGNNLITPTVLQVLLRCFRDGSMRELEFLGLDHNFLSRECLDALALQLVSGQCPQLRELCVGGNLGLSENDISSAFRDVADSAAGACWGLFRATYSAKSSSSLAEHEGGRRSKRQRRE
uniref:Uncharacterized protein n=1 Tax=Globisporangium ultimum (strain ATCC 200006 / CBS 805.95 / DAOM BR144) TaxID=431595 RepID=K3WVP0_GLOUD